MVGQYKYVEQAALLGGRLQKVAVPVCKGIAVDHRRPDDAAGAGAFQARNKPVDSPADIFHQLVFLVEGGIVELIFCKTGLQGDLLGSIF